jgi:hypothetical protein
MLWIKWYQTVFWFVLYNIAILQANSNYNYKYFVPVYLSMIISYVYFNFLDKPKNNKKQDEYIDDYSETIETKIQNK